MKRAHIVWVMIVVLLGSFVLALESHKFKRIEKRGPAVESVAVILPADVNATEAAIGDAFNGWADYIGPNRAGYRNKYPDGSTWSRLFLFRKNDPQHPLFPRDDEILLDRGVDDFVERYVRIPADLRTRDLYLYEPTGDYYWESEYFYHGQAAKFRCSFLIHIEPAKDLGTRVEIFEYQPMIWVGEYFGMSAHGVLPSMLHDIRPEQSTTADRKQVLQAIEEAAARRG